MPVRQTSSTHGANGYITTDPSEIQAGVERLQRKIESLRGPSPSELEARAVPGADCDLRNHGPSRKSSCGGDPRESGQPVSVLALKTLWPVPEYLLLEAAEKWSGSSWSR